MYAALATRPDLAFSVAVLSRFCENPTLVHWNALKRILRYVVDNIDLGIVCVKRDQIDIVAYSDSDLAGDVDSRKTTSGHLILLSGTPVIWRSTKQSVVATSTCEAEFVAASQLVKDIIWLRNILFELVQFQPPSNPLHIDNLGTIKLIQNNQSNSKTKHLDIKLHHVRDAHDKKIIKVLPVSTEDQLADVFTKALPQDKHPDFVDQVCKNESYYDKFHDYNSNEMSAAEVLLMSIEELLKHGYLDTRALGELVNDDELIALEPSSVHVNKVIVDRVNHMVQFISDIVTERGLWERIIWTDVLGCFAALAIFVLFTVVGYIYRKAVRRDEKTRATVEQIQLSTVGGTGSHVQLLPDESRAGSRGNVEANAPAAIHKSDS